MSDSDTVTVEGRSSGEVTVDAEDLVEAIDEVLVNGATGGRHARVGDVIVSCDGHDEDEVGTVIHEEGGVEAATWVDLEEAREKAEEQIVRADIEDEKHLKCTSSSYGCIIPISADFEVSEKGEYAMGNHTVFFNKEDDVSNLNSWSGHVHDNYEYTSGAHVNSIEVLDPEDVADTLRESASRTDSDEQSP